MAVIQALLSVMSDQGDVIHSISVGTSSIEFLLRGQLYLVAVSSRGEAQLALRRQLELLYQSILMVATGGERPYYWRGGAGGLFCSAHV
jgi:hypothetical protein